MFAILEIMPTATITTKGQVTIPVQVRSALGLDRGDRVEFVEVEKGRFLIMAANQPIQKLKGMIRKPKKPVSIAQMNAAIALHKSQANTLKR